jgi:hypothetical protein
VLAALRGERKRAGKRENRRERRERKEGRGKRERTGGEDERKGEGEGEKRLWNLEHEFYDILTNPSSSLFLASLMPVGQRRIPPNDDEG